MGILKICVSAGFMLGIKAKETAGSRNEELVINEVDQVEGKVVQEASKNVNELKYKVFDLVA